MKKLVIWLPFIVFVGFLLVFASGLFKPDDHMVRSALIGKPVPSFVLPAAVEGGAGLSTRDLQQGRPVLLNVFASWCIPCAAETPVLVQLKAKNVVIEGLAIRDRPADVSRFLARYGNPFDRIAMDNKSAVQLALGSSGVPESFVIDGQGVIRYQHQGPIAQEDIPTILKALEDAR